MTLYWYFFFFLNLSISAIRPNMIRAITKIEIFATSKSGTTIGTRRCDLRLEKRSALFLQPRRAMANLSGVVSVRRPITHVVFDMDGLLLGIPSIFTIACHILVYRHNFLNTHAYTFIVY